MMRKEEEEEEEAELRGGPYLGEISALALLPASPSPLLLAGSGSELLLYDLRSGLLHASFPVFRGVRLHGIRVHADHHVCVFGEARLKLFLFRAHALDLQPLPQPPPFDRWVLDARFLPADRLLAVGLADNSLALLHLPSASLLARLRSPHRSLLYSMALHGHSLPSLRVAAGTVLNQIVLWRLQPQPDHPAALTLALLTAHQGSIFSLAWAHDASKLISASDDRR